MKLTKKQKQKIINAIAVYEKLSNKREEHWCNYDLDLIGEHKKLKCTDSRLPEYSDMYNVCCQICWNMVKKYVEETKKKTI